MKLFEIYENQRYEKREGNRKADDFEIGEDISFLDNAMRPRTGVVEIKVKKGETVPNPEPSKTKENSWPDEPAYTDYIFVRDHELDVLYAIILFSHTAIGKLKKNAKQGVKSSYPKLSSKNREMLGYLVHSKEHVFEKPSRNSDMEDVLSNYSEKYTNPLYRGVSKQELKSMLDGKTTYHYTSYSEDRKVAEGFGTVVTLLPPISAFNYGKYQIDVTKALKTNDPESYDQEDGDHLIETAELEKEWIMPREIKFIVEDSEKLIFKLK